jgi:TRAP-type uncharacterized transport system substrate-binding protein
MCPSGATCCLNVLYWLTRNQVNVSEWSDLLTKRVILVDSESGQCVRVERPKNVGQVNSEHHDHVIECNLFKQSIT